MEFELLRSLQIVAREENLTAAAEKLCVTQPTLTRRLDNLEQECGRKLLVRGKRKTTLTEEGKLMLRYAENILSLYDRMEEDIYNFDKLISGELVLGCVNTTAVSYMSKVVGILHEKYPITTYYIKTMAAQEMEESIKEGTVDFGLLYEVIDYNQFDSVRLPVTNYWGLVMRKDDPLAKKQYITAKDLQNIPLITPEPELTRSILNGWGGIDPDHLNIVLKYYLTNNVPPFVQEGLGYGLVMDNTMDLMKVYDFAFLPLKPERSANANIIWNKHLELSRLGKVFLNELTKIVEQE